MMIASLCLAAAPPAYAQAPAPSAVTVTVDTASAGPVINRHIYGQFAEHLGKGIYDGVWVGEKSRIPNTNGFRNDVIAALKDIKVPTIRWPGGCFADYYRWMDGIGPRDQRPVRVNTNWGGVEENNAFGTHEYMNFMELLGADAYVSGNVGTLGPLDMADWVEYMTSDSKSTLAELRRRNGREKPWKLPYFGFGNELWGCGGNMRGSYAADLTRRYTSFVNAPDGQTMVKVAAGPTGSRSDAEVYGFAETLMRDGGRFDALSVHWYVRTPKVPGAGGGMANRSDATGFPESEWAGSLVMANRMEEIITKTSAVMDKYDPSKRVALYIDEWGTWHAPTPGSNPDFLEQQNTLRDAEVAALTFNIFHRHTDRVKLAAIAQMVNVLQAPILTDKEKMVLTPTYWVHHMYVPFMDATPYAATVAEPKYTNGPYVLEQVDVSAARGKDGKLYLSLVNTDPNKPARVTTNLTGAATGRILTANTMDAHNSFAAPNTIHPVPFQGRQEAGRLVLDLPAKSIAVVAVQ